MGCSFILPYFRNPFIARRWSPRIFSGAAGTAAAPATSKMVKAIRIHELGGPENVAVKILMEQYFHGEQFKEFLGSFEF